MNPGRVRIDRLHIRVAGLTRSGARTLAETVAARLSAERAETRGGTIGGIMIRMPASNTGLAGLADAIAARIREALR